MVLGKGKAGYDDETSYKASIESGTAAERIAAARALAAARSGPAQQAIVEALRAAGFQVEPTAAPPDFVQMAKRAGHEGAPWLKLSGGR